jgi:glutamate--cysteine ligase
MSTREAAAPGREITSRNDLVGWIAAGEKPRAGWRIGTEHEKFAFHADTLAPVAYNGPSGIRALMEGMMARYGWEPILEGETLIALRRPKSETVIGTVGGTISLEPGGQFELSGGALTTLHETAAETRQHMREVLAVGEALGLGFLGVGFTPLWPLADVPSMPKQRYKVMTGYMPKVGSRGLDMMYRTATIQVNLDFGTEADMVQKLRVSLALQPIATALFASSPFTDGKPNGFKSMRSEVWRDTDNRRTGMLPFAFDPGMGYERYVDYALDVPMYFVYRDGRYIDVAGASFRTFMDGKLDQLQGERATMDDWSDHLTTLFPEVRLKRFLEMRGADSGGEANITALSAFWTGLLYDQSALDGAFDLIKSWTAEERQALRDQVPKSGLATKFRGAPLRQVTQRVLELSAAGLKVRHRLDERGQDESIHLAPLTPIAASSTTLADELLALYHGRWNGEVLPVFKEYAYKSV